MQRLASMKVLGIAAMGTVGVVAAPTEAAFMIEAHPTGKANANFTFDTEPGTSTAASNAAGVTATGSRFGGTGTAIDRYYFTYTPGTDVDNTVYPAGTDLGNGNLATGLTGGSSGLYNVYFTTPATTSTTSDSTFTITNDGATVTTVVNTGNTPAENAWLLLGTVPLTAGNSYVVTQTSGDSTFTSQRTHGVMFEAVPEPGSMALLAMGAAGLLVRRRRS